MTSPPGRPQISSQKSRTFWGRSARKQSVIGGTTGPLTRKAALQVPLPADALLPALFIRTTELSDHVFQEKCARERRKRRPGMHKKCAGKKAGQSPQQNPCDKLPATPGKYHSKKKKIHATGNRNQKSSSRRKRRRNFSGDVSPSISVRRLRRRSLIPA